MRILRLEYDLRECHHINEALFSLEGIDCFRRLIFRNMYDALLCAQAFLLFWAELGMQTRPLVCVAR